MCLIFEVLPSRLPLRRPHSVVRFCLTGLLVFIGRIMSLLEALEEDLLPCLFQLLETICIL